jgi:hypothetical protein
MLTVSSPGSKCVVFLMARVIAGGGSGCVSGLCVVVGCIRGALLWVWPGTCVWRGCSSWQPQVQAGEVSVSVCWG